MMATTPPVHPRTRSRTTPFTCRACGGPCRQFAGSVHGWTCAACIDTHLNRQHHTADNTTMRSALKDQR